MCAHASRHVVISQNAEWRVPTRRCRKETQPDCSWRWGCQGQLPALD